jgi:DNA adenine methylase
VLSDTVRADSGSTSPVTPFLKWAGGKRWLVRDCPELLETSFDRYVEPFIGSGAVFFSLCPQRAIISDTNAELILTYAAVKADWQAVWRELERMQQLHCEEFYYTTRASLPATDTLRAARFLYLNRTCWNALYRVNRRGEFNVPIGTKTDVLAGGELSSCAKALESAEIIACDFGVTMQKAGPGDLIYVDPPYTVRHNVNGFLKYNQTLFSWEDQIRLRDEVIAAQGRGAKVIVSNAAHESVRALYSGVGEIQTLERASVIAGKSSARRREQEIIVKCF